MSTKGNRKPKDVNAPKKNQSSYFIYSNERRPILQRENTGQGVTEISKIISAEWKAMDPSAKSKYEQLAEEQKKRYQEELSVYQKTENYKNYQQKLAEWTERQKAMGRFPGAKGKGKNKKAPKKPKQPEEMPKRPQSSYFIFSNERRNQLKEQYPDKKITELSGLIAVEWKAKTAEEKKVYEDQAAVNKEKYKSEMEEYKKTEQYAQFQQELENWKREKKAFEKGMDDDNDGIGKISLPRKPKDDKCPKRPLTSYFLYAKAVREQTKTEFPDKAITEIAKEISKKWKVLTEEEKKPYEDEAARLKQQYKSDMAEYEGSDAQKAYQAELAKWKIECDKRRQSAKDKYLKKQQMAAAKNKKKVSPKGKGKGRGRGKQTKRMSVDSDSSSDESSSSDDSSSDSDSDSDSSSDSSSSDDSSSDESSSE